VLTTAIGAARLEGRLPAATTVLPVGGADAVDLRAAVEALRARGHELILSEAGPRAFASLVAARLVDELFLTVSPLIAGRGAVGRKPANLSFEEAAAVPVAAITALQGLRDKGGLQPGQKVLVNGASGGVGTFAVQIAKLLGADLTAVCSTRNVETARSLGADRVVDYTREDFTRIGERFDLVLDVSGTRSWSDYKRILAPGATHVIVGAPRPGARLLGPLRHVIKLRLASLGSSRKVVFFIAKLNKPDLAYLAELLESGAIRPVIEKTYSLGETAEALRYLGEGHARGKLVITV
jgi:NADPH:quinone reductase-like Zn-dependent oxidoreductase